MSLIKAKNTKPELIVRKLAWSLGYRYRLHVRKLPGQPDLSFGPQRKAIFVHGCFWHRHRNCRQYVMPKSRLSFWLPKLEYNVARDRQNRRKLRAMGWRVLTIWECQLKQPDRVSRRILDFLKG